MTHRYLEVTYRNGRAVAAYLYLPRKQGDISTRTERRVDGLLVDYAADGRAIGVEITAPMLARRDNLNALLAELAQEPLTEPEIAPLGAA
jgi:hypothetical protein